MNNSDCFGAIPDGIVFCVDVGDWTSSLLHCEFYINASYDDTVANCNIRRGAEWMLLMTVMKCRHKTTFK